MKNIPEQIYLQIGDIENSDFNELSEVTWCKDKVHNTDIEYVRKKSPWINVEEKHPPYEEDKEPSKRTRYLVRVISGSAEPKVSYTLAWLTSRYHFNVEMDWVKATHWMPIPKFNE